MALACPNFYNSGHNPSLTGSEILQGTHQFAVTICFPLFFQMAMTPFRSIIDHKSPQLKDLQPDKTSSFQKGI